MVKVTKKKGAYEGQGHQKKRGGANEGQGHQKKGAPQWIWIY
jgi:hypothetical protein